MAEINTTEVKKEGGKKRSKKASTRVDLTAMVDLGFLLITFFMLATTMSEPKAMQVNKPAKLADEKIEMPVIPQSKTLSLVLGKNDRLYAYSGADEGTNYQIDSMRFSRSGLREIVKKRQIEVGKKWQDPQDLFVMIKPSAGSNYRNLVDVLDEMAICKVSRYAILDEFNELDQEIIRKTGNEIAVLKWRK
jgi:biopolymer transport protein ExbD